jgi:transcriptional regulator with XRE-family HTH domain
MRPADPARVIKDLGRRIAELRRERGLTQEQFAENLGVSAGYVRRLESGVNLTMRSLVGIANALKVPNPDLLRAPQDRKIRLGRPKA